MLPEKAEAYVEEAYRELRTDDVKMILDRAYEKYKSEKEETASGKGQTVPGTDRDKDLRKKEGCPDGEVYDNEDW